MNFNEALDLINANETVTRRKWQNKAKVYLVKNNLTNINHIEIRTVGNCMMYAASSEDLLANDWELINKEVAEKKVKVPQDEIVL